MKLTKGKLIAIAAILVVLAAAFWFGGGAPGTQGWTVDAPPTVSQPVKTAAPSVTPAPTQSTDPAVTSAPKMEETPAPSVEPTSGAAQRLEATPAPVKTESPKPVATPKPTQDLYQTDPVPTGRPQPVEPQDAETGETAYTCTLSISCETILNHMDWLDPEKAELVPEDGVILPPTQVTFYEGESVFNVLRRVCKQQKIHMEFEDTPIYNSAYIEGIHNLYEFDCGEQSGWMYSVNGWFPNYGCSRYQLQNGDIVKWVYTCDLGDDVGGSNAVGG